MTGIYASYLVVLDSDGVVSLFSLVPLTVYGVCSSQGAPWLGAEAIYGYLLVNQPGAASGCCEPSWHEHVALACQAARPPLLHSIHGGTKRTLAAIAKSARVAGGCIDTVHHTRGQSSDAEPAPHL